MKRDDIWMKRNELYPKTINRFDKKSPPRGGDLYKKAAN